MRWFLLILCILVIFIDENGIFIDENYIIRTESYAVLSSHLRALAEPAYKYTYAQGHQ